MALVPLSWLIGVLTLVFVIISITVVAFLTAPIFTTTICGALAMIIGFVVTESTESWTLVHGNMESENRFWALVAGVLASAVFFAADSPFHIGGSYPYLGMALVMGMIIITHMIDHRLSHNLLVAPPHLRRVNSTIFGANGLARAKEKAKNIKDALNRLNYTFFALKPLNRRDIFIQEERIISILRNATSEELNYLVTNVNLSRLLYKVKDRDIMVWKFAYQQPPRTAILNLLAVERLDELSLEARVGALDAMQNMRLSAHPRAEEYVSNIFLATTGLNLTFLKCALDTKGGAQNLHKLIFVDIKSDLIRSRILTHIKREAREVAPLVPLRKILSDIDDTLYASGGSWPAGIDASFKKHQLYPGVLTFYKELDLGYSQSGIWDPSKKGNLVFLSARPHVYKDISEQKAYHTFEKLRNKEGTRLHAVPTLLAGDLGGGWSMVTRDNMDPMALRKFENFDQYASLYPEYGFVFIGDNGQGDVKAGELMKEKHQFAMEAVLMHTVQPIHLTPGFDSKCVNKWERYNIKFFTTYVGAAVRAARCDLIHPRGLRRIAEDAKRELKVLLPHMASGDANARRVELNADIEEANVFLRTTQVKLISPVPADCMFPIGCLVNSPYGLGVVLQFQADNNIYQLDLLDWALTQGKYAQCYVHVTQITLSSIRATKTGAFVAPGDAILTPFGTGVLLELTANGIHAVGLRCKDFISQSLEEEKYRLKRHWNKPKIGLSPNSSPSTRALTGRHPASLNQAAEVPFMRGPNDPEITMSFLHDIGCNSVGYFHHSTISAIEAAMGDFVETPYGLGMVNGYRKKDKTYIVKFSWGTGYLDRNSVRQSKNITSGLRAGGICTVQ